MRKGLTITAIVLLSLMVVLGSGVLLLQNSRVQTFIIHKVSVRLSEELGADIHIARFQYQPLSRLSVDSVYLSDQQRDTLVFVEHLYVQCHPLLIRDGRLDFTRIELERPYINIQQATDTSLNCMFLIEKLKSDSSDFAYRLNIDALRLTDMRVRYKELLVDQLNVDFRLPVFSSDSLDFKIESLSLQAQLDRLDAGFRADIHGDLDSLCADEMRLTYRGKTLFDGDCAVLRPTRLDSLYVHADCNDVFLNQALLQDFLSQLLRRPFRLPKPVASLGDVHYKGYFDGRLEDMRLHGVLTSAVGSVTVNGQAKTDTTFQNVDFCGKVSTRRFHLGRLLNNRDLGNVALGAHVDLSAGYGKPLVCGGEVHVDKIEFRKHAYRNIRFKGGLNDEVVDGDLRIDDPDIALIANGVMDWSADDARIDLSAVLQHFRPGALNLTAKLPELQVDTKTDVSIFTSGSSPAQMLDNMTGYVILDTLKLVNGEDSAVINEIKVQIDNWMERKKVVRQVKVQSDILTAGLTGNFAYSTLPATFEGFVRQYLPSLQLQSNYIKHHDNNMDFYAYFRDLEDLTSTLRLSVAFPSYPTIKGYLHETGNEFGVQAYIPMVEGEKASMENLTISANNEDNRLKLSVFSRNHLPQDNPTTAKLGDIKTHLDVTAKDDVIGLNIRLNNTDSVRNQGELYISTKLQRYANKPIWDVHIHPTDITLNDSVWSIADSHIIYTVADQTLSVEHFGLTSSGQAIRAHGMASASDRDSIHVALENININYLLSYTNVAHALSVEGPLTGWATVYGLFSEPMFEAQATIPQAGLNGVYLGQALAEAHLDRENKTVVITGDVVDSAAHTLAHVDGLVKPKGLWELDIACDSVDLGIVNFWTKGILSDIKGLGYGNLHIGGVKRETFITAGLYGKDAQLTVPTIGATFYFSDSVILDSTAIRFPHITLHDAEGHVGHFSGALTHTQFEDFHYNMVADVDNMLALNLPYDPQSIFYGKVYGSGVVDISGDESECRINVNARTESKSKFYLSINTASNAASTSYINFVQPDTTSNELLRLLQSSKKKEHKKVQEKQKGSTRIILNLLIEANPLAEINLRMGGDDGLKGRGEGNLRFHYDSRTEDIQLLGTYTLQSGTFNFSLGNIVRRSFEIAEGSRVLWSGDPTAPTVDVTGKYHLTASLRDLYGSEIEQLATNRTSVPVNCVLHMTDQLFNPIISFAIELPQSDESVQSQVRSLINTNEMLMRQVIYLLVFNRFYTPDYLQNTKNVGLNETYSLLSSTITGQINSWLSKLTDIFSMGFNIRTDGEGSTASQEYEANFQLHPINQLLINGNFGYRYNDISNRPFFGDLDIEYMLTENGKLRAKAYTHTVDKYSIKQANTVQGIGFVFKHDFNWKPIHKKDTAQITVPAESSRDTIPIQ